MRAWVRSFGGRATISNCSNNYGPPQVVTGLLAAFRRSEDKIEFVTDRTSHDRRYAIRSDKLAGELGWSPRYEDLENGLAATIEWYQSHGVWWRPPQDCH